MKKNLMCLAAVLGLLVLVALPGSAAAQTSAADPPTGQAATAESIMKAQDLLSSRAKNSLALIQMGCTLKGVNAKTVTRHADGTFTISVRYHWSGLDNGQDHTDIHYKFTGNGRLADVNVGGTTAIIFTPFSVANRTIEVLWDAIRDSLRDAPQRIRDLAEQYLRDANARGLHKVIVQHWLSR